MSMFNMSWIQLVHFSVSVLEKVINCYGGSCEDIMTVVMKSSQVNSKRTSTEYYYLAQWISVTVQTVAINLI